MVTGFNLLSYGYPKVTFGKYELWVAGTDTSLTIDLAPVIRDSRAGEYIELRFGDSEINMRRVRIRYVDATATPVNTPTLTTSSRLECTARGSLTLLDRAFWQPLGLPLGIIVPDGTVVNPIAWDGDRGSPWIFVKYEEQEGWYSANTTDEKHFDCGKLETWAQTLPTRTSATALPPTPTPILPSATPVPHTATFTPVPPTATLTPTPTPTTPKPPSGLDILSAAPDALWASGAGNLPFANGDERGGAGYFDNYMLEDGNRYYVLQTHPQWINDGYIFGDFYVPWIESGQHFMALIGLGMPIGGSGSDGVMVTVLLNDIIIYQTVKKYTGSLTPIDVDLSAFAEQPATLTLEVSANGYSNQDWLSWVDPRIAFP